MLKSFINWLKELFGKNEKACTCEKCVCKKSVESIEKPAVVEKNVDNVKKVVEKKVDKVSAESQQTEQVEKPKKKVTRKTTKKEEDKND